jgi:hypothetical protein
VRVRPNNSFYRPLNNISKGAIADLPGEPCQSRCIVQGNVVGLVTFYFVLGLVLARKMHVSFVVNVLCMHSNNPAAHAPRL